LISSALSDIEQDWFLTNEQMAEARKKMNDETGSRRVFCHMIFTPEQPGWLDKLDAGLALKPESCKGYTIGDNTHKEISRYPWRMDDEEVAYKGYEKMVKAGIRNVCVHKGLFAPGVKKEFPHLRGFADVADVGQAAKDWPQLNFIIYHSATVTSAEIQSRRWRSSSAPAASLGPAILLTFRRSTTSTTSMATSVNCLRQRLSPNLTCAWL
jgi:uncharacterized protein